MSLLNIDSLSRSELLRVGRDVFGQNRPREDQSARPRLELANLHVSDRGDLVVVHAVDLIDRLGHVADLLQRLRVEDVALLDRDREHDHVRAAEGLPEMVVGLDVGVSLRKQVGKLAVHLDLARVVREEDGDEQDRSERYPGVPQHPASNAYEKSFKHGSPRLAPGSSGEVRPRAPRGVRAAASPRFRRGRGREERRLGPRRRRRVTHPGRS